MDHPWQPRLGSAIHRGDNICCRGCCAPFGEERGWLAVRSKVPPTFRLISPRGGYAGWATHGHLSMGADLRQGHLLRRPQTCGFGTPAPSNPRQDIRRLSANCVDFAQIEMLPRRSKQKRPRRAVFNRLILLRKIWSGRRDSNPRPQPWQGCALPLSYARAPRRRLSNPPPPELQAAPSRPTRPPNASRLAGRCGSYM